MSKVERAIILAAGKGTRLQPITYEVPKPLIKVNGRRMIDTIIDGLHNNGIYEIYLVVGYLKEKFDYLKDKYDGIRIIENPYYDSCNNISSLYVARDYLENSIIMDADQIIYNDNILFREFSKSGYNCTWSNNLTNEWLLTVDKNNIVISCSRQGGQNGWRLYSISRWNRNDGLKLKQYLEKEFIEKNNTQIYWDDLALFCYPNDFQLTIYKMNNDDIIEIDSIEELMEVDSSYKNNV